MDPTLFWYRGQPLRVVSDSSGAVWFSLDHLADVVEDRYARDRIGPLWIRSFAEVPCLHPLDPRSAFVHREGVFRYGLSLLPRSEPFFIWIESLLLPWMQRFGDDPLDRESGRRLRDYDAFLYEVQKALRKYGRKDRKLKRLQRKKGRMKGRAAEQPSPDAVQSSNLPDAEQPLPEQPTVPTGRRAPDPPQIMVFNILGQLLQVIDDGDVWFREENVAAIFRVPRSRFRKHRRPGDRDYVGYPGIEAMRDTLSERKRRKLEDAFEWIARVILPWMRYTGGFSAGRHGRVRLARYDAQLGGGEKERIWREVQLALESKRVQLLRASGKKREPLRPL